MKVKLLSPGLALSLFFSPLDVSEVEIEGESSFVFESESTFSFIFSNLTS